MKPSTLNEDQWGKVVKATVYVGISAMISYLIALIAKDPDLFGQLTPVINIVLVIGKQIFTPSS